MAVTRKAKAKGHRKGPTPKAKTPVPKTKVAEVEDSDEDVDDRAANDVREPSAAEQAALVLKAQRKLVFLQKKEALQKQLDALREEEDVPEVPARSKKDKKDKRDKKGKSKKEENKKRKRSVTSSESEDGFSDVSEDESQEDLGEDEESDTVDESDGEDKSGKSKKRAKLDAGKEGKPHSTREVLEHWRRVAKHLPRESDKREMRRTLRLLQSQRKSIDTRGVAKFERELDVMWCNAHGGALVAQRFELNQSSKRAHVGIDMKAFALASKQVALETAATSKNERGGPSPGQVPKQRQRSQHKVQRQQAWNKYERPLQSERLGAPVCFRCKKPGHKVGECPSPDKKGEREKP